MSTMTLNPPASGNNGTMQDDDRGSSTASLEFTNSDFQSCLDYPEIRAPTFHMDRKMALRDMELFPKKVEPFFTLKHAR